ncbi:putative TNF receptor-associated factor 5 [Paratrimastix pyriformis]|uniref:TNF receptor-associated factor 5 n=1 Tax=Paratrimastix pyriformis TaxID=342808 RepID=A0ABQ8UKR1_9EUKA|nr:putative TNF receptor-associated factor 5 [Paratrimastix pyriformis]
MLAQAAGGPLHVGYSPQIFLQEVDNVFLCAYCHGVMCQPVTLSCSSSHKICRHCCTELSKTEPLTCPSCHEPVKTHQLDIPFKTLIDHLTVRCIVCGDWTGPLEAFEQHAECLCPSRVVGCPHPGCSHTCRALELADHMLVCDYRCVPCELACGADVIAKDMQSHLGTTCPRMAIPCTYCTVTLPRGDIPTHLEVCPEMPVDCPVPGCLIRPPRVQLSAHLHDAAVDHVAALTALLRETQAELAAKTTECLQLREDLKRVVASDADTVTVQISSPAAMTPARKPAPLTKRGRPRKERRGKGTPAVEQEEEARVVVPLE